MQCLTNQTGCFKSECIRYKRCQEKKEANYEVTVTVQKTYLINAKDKIDALQIVGGNFRPIPDITKVISSNVKQLTI